ncbi:MAG: GNAT family N-acetyltransferase [Alphaproteobacteria bacterium]|nr:GNAT family N-acetyltransferase [Alphaproteobacteria bacterium]
MPIKVNEYEVRLTRSSEERRQVRNLRYRVFCEEEGAHATEEQKALMEEYDSYDRFAEYMAVFHNGKVVGTYRIINREAAEKLGGFYTETEYNISKLKRVKGNIIEMSRACIDIDYRDSLAVRLLWMGLANYILENKVVLVFGVSSFVGTKPVEFAQCFSYLYYNHLAPVSLRPTVLPEKMGTVDRSQTKMNILPRSHVDEKLAWQEMTPILKGYMRLGAKVGKGIFVDEPFNSCDVFTFMKTKDINKVYQKHFLGNPNAFDHLGIKPTMLNQFGKVLLSPVTGLVALAEFFLEPEEAAEVKRGE